MSENKRLQGLKADPGLQTANGETIPAQECEVQKTFDYKNDGGKNASGKASVWQGYILLFKDSNRRILVGAGQLKAAAESQKMDDAFDQNEHGDLLQNMTIGLEDGRPYFGA